MVRGYLICGIFLKNLVGVPCIPGYPQEEEAFLNRHPIYLFMACLCEPPLLQSTPHHYLSSAYILTILH